MRNWLRPILQTAGAVLLIGYVVYRAGLADISGWQALGQRFHGADPMLLVASICMQPVQQAQVVYKWLLFARFLELGVGYPSLLRIYLLGRFFNLFVPGGIGGDLTRAHLLGKSSGRLDDSIASVVADRLTGMLVLIVATIVTLPLVIGAFFGPLVWLTGYTMLFTFMLIAWLILRWVWSVRRVKQIETFPGFAWILAKTKKIVLPVIKFFATPEVRWRVIAQGCLFIVLSVLNFWITTLVFAQDFGLWDAFVSVPLMLFIANLPLSIGNLGTMEFAFVVVLGIHGIEADVALGSSAYEGQDAGRVSARRAALGW